MLKMATEPEYKEKYIKLTKHLLMATILITVSMSLIDLPKQYYGSKVGWCPEASGNRTDLWWSERHILPAGQSLLRLFHCAPGGRMFQRVKVPNPPDSGK